MKKYLTCILIICCSLAGCSMPELSEIKTLELAVYISDSQLSRSGLAQAVNAFNDKTKEVITKIEFNASVDYDLYNIMMEEADYLFNDSTRTEEDVINIIQSRAQIYVSENK